MIVVKEGSVCVTLFFLSEISALTSVSKRYDQLAFEIDTVFQS